MATMSESVDNDTRGWIMAGVSGVACIFGACVICVDYAVRLFPGKRDFSIRDSDIFLSSSLSLSFGVMLFSALYSMLPAAKRSFIDGGASPAVASWALIGAFIGGVIGIQILSRIFHHFIPSHVVGCEHTHDDEEEARNTADEARHGHHTSEGSHSHHRSHTHAPVSPTKSLVADEENQHKGSHESQPLLKPKPERPPPLTSRVSSFLVGKKPVCDGKGPCFGLSEPCGNECFKSKLLRPSLLAAKAKAYGTNSLSPKLLSEDDRSNTDGPVPYDNACGASGHLNSSRPQESDQSSSTSTVASLRVHSAAGDGHEDHHHGEHDHPKRHHHHVPSNAFLSIGLQTSFAIALHKLPEGFITYATNHANPELGFSIFIALFIHNITEGFALALPLFLAIQSRWKAIIIASILGGASQPLGAGIAALWFKIAGSRDLMTSDMVYGYMFAITSGIMTSVALQLFSESLGLTHNKTVCIVWAFVGMGVLGISNALTA